MIHKIRNKFVAARIYRERAEELRTIADGMTGEVERDLLMKLAAENERLAICAEARGKLGQHMSPY